MGQAKVKVGKGIEHVDENSGQDAKEKITKKIGYAPLGTDSDISYRPVPHRDVGGETATRMIWRIRLESILDRSKPLGLDISGDVILGRGKDEGEIVDLSSYKAEELGVSRRHALLHPTETKLFVTDQKTTNGTRLNGRRIGVGTPYALNNGDLLSLGSLEFVMRIVQRPGGEVGSMRRRADLGEALTGLARAITSELDTEEVLNQALEMAMQFTAAGETAIWLVDKESGELFLEAERGIEDEKIRRMRLPATDSLAGKVLESGEPVRAGGEAGGDPVKIKTDYLVEALVYVPLVIGGIPIGVLAAAHREAGKTFDVRDEQILLAVADFAAIAIQNARLFRASEDALSELQSAVAHDMRGPISSIKGLAQLLKRIASLDEQGESFVDRIVRVSDNTLELIDDLLDIASLSRVPESASERCDLSKTVARAIGDLEGVALARSIDLDLELKGTAYPIKGDGVLLYRSVMNLIDNAIKYTPPDTKVLVTLTYGGENVTIQVRDRGPGIPEDELPHVFEKFFRGKPPANPIKKSHGLGLSIVKSTAEAHGGEAEVRNVEGGGAEFTVTLPGSLRVA